MQQCLHRRCLTNTSVSGLDWNYKIHEPNRTEGAVLEQNLCSDNQRRHYPCLEYMCI